MKQGWTYKKVGDVIEHLRTGLNPRTHFKLNTPDAEGYYITVRELKGFSIEPDEKTDKVNSAAIKRINERSKLKPGDVLFSGTGTIGKTALVNELPENWNIKEGVYAMTPKHSELDSKYFIYYIGSDSFLHLVNEKATGTGVRSIPMKELVKLPISVPSLAEQERIVERLDAAFAQIDELKSNAERQLAEARALMSSEVDQILINTAWKKYTLESICSQITDGTHRTPKYTSSGIPFLSVKNITKGFLDFDNTKFISKDEHELLIKRCYPEFGDILYTKVGTTGIAKVIDIKKEFSIFVSVALLKLNKSLVYNHFLEYVLNSPYVYKQSQKLTSGTANRNFLLNDIKKVELYLPSIEEQKNLTLYLKKVSSNISKLEQISRKTAAECDAMKQALLRQIFE